MKTPKNYRLSMTTMEQLDDLKKLLPGRTETEIVEDAITHYLFFQTGKATRKKDRSL